MEYPGLGEYPLIKAPQACPWYTVNEGQVTLSRIRHFREARIGFLHEGGDSANYRLRNQGMCLNYLPTYTLLFKIKLDRIAHSCFITVHYE